MSTIGDRWLSDVLMEEWLRGVVDGFTLAFLVGVFFACCVVTYALSEAGDET